MAGILESAINDAVIADTNDDTALEVSLLGDPAIETELVLTALQVNSSPEEFDNLIQEHALEMELYGVITDADAAMEAQRNIVKLNKSAKFSAIQRRAAIRLAMKANDPNYQKYRKYRDMMRDYRDKIYSKYDSKATREARVIIQNARRRASGMNVDAGRSITDRMDKEIERLKDKD